MKLSPKHKMIIINPWRLKRDLKQAVNNFLTDLEKDKVLRKVVHSIYKKIPLEGQVMKTSKFEYLIENK